MNFLKKIFKFKQANKSYDKYGNILQKTLTTKEQRLEAIEVLQKLAPEYGVPQLLKRFELVLESGLQDNKEKEMCMEHIISTGHHACIAVKKALASHKRLAWLIKIAEKIFAPEEYVDLLFANLKLDMAFFDEDNIVRNEEILLALRDIDDERIINITEEFLHCRNEDLRIAALECLARQANKFHSAKMIIINLEKNISFTDDNSRFIGILNELTKKYALPEQQ